MQKKMLFIFNPTTGGGRLKSSLLEIICRLTDVGYALRVCPTKAQGDARKIAHELAEKYDVVVCCGGDGTLNEVVDGMAHLRELPLLGYIPGGTTCDFAASLKLPRTNMLAAVNRIVDPEEERKCDLGMLNGRAFVYVAAFGAFTNVPYKTPQRHKNVLGYFAYLVEGMQQLPRMESSHVRIVCDGQHLEDDYLLGMITNSTSVAGFSFPNKQKIQLDDGIFEVILVKKPKNLSDLGALSGAVLGGTFQSHLLTIMRASEIEFSFDSEMDWTLDGEFGGAVTRAAIEVRRQAFRICV